MHMFDFEAAIHHDAEAGITGFGGRRLIDDTKLHPQTLRADGDRLIGDYANCFRFAKTSDQIYQDPLFAQRRIGGGE